MHSRFNDDAKDEFWEQQIVKKTEAYEKRRNRSKKKEKRQRAILIKEKRYEDDWDY